MYLCQPMHLCVEKTMYLYQPMHLCVEKTMYLCQPMHLCVEKKHNLSYVLKFKNVILLSIQ